MVEAGPEGEREGKVPSASRQFRDIARNQRLGRTPARGGQSPGEGSFRRRFYRHRAKFVGHLMGKVERIPGL